MTEPASVADGSPDAADELARRCAAAMYAADRASRELGIEIRDIGVGRATAVMRVRETMVNGHDMCHGGYVFLLADTAFAFACNTYGPVTVAAACDVVFVAPAMAGDELVATATERHRYGRSGIYDVTVRRADGFRTGEFPAGELEESVVAEFRGHSRMSRATPLHDEGAEHE